MQNVGRKLAFVLASTNQGTMLVNRFDYRMVDQHRGFGVGFQLLETASFDPLEVKLATQLLTLRRKYFGDGVVAIDCGANIGVHTVEWANLMVGWGSVLAIEAQERIFYALAGNVTINNCFNAAVINAAVSSEGGTLSIPRPNYMVPSSFGSLELRQRPTNEFIGQQIDYVGNTVEVRKLPLDEFQLARCDLIKIDIEGMELEALEGAKATIERCRPAMLIEKIKADAGLLRQWLETRGYKVMEAGINILAVHATDRTLNEIVAEPQPVPA
jgi:FkbM family methyltransferase